MYISLGIDKWPACKGCYNKERDDIDFYTTEKIDDDIFVKLHFLYDKFKKKECPLGSLKQQQQQQQLLLLQPSQPQQHRVQQQRVQELLKKLQKPGQQQSQQQLQLLYDQYKKSVNLLDYRIEREKNKETDTQKHKALYKCEHSKEKLFLKYYEGLIEYIKFILEAVQIDILICNEYCSTIDVLEKHFNSFSYYGLYYESDKIKTSNKTQNVKTLSKSIVSTIKEEGNGKKEEGNGKKEEGNGKREESKEKVYGEKEEVNRKMFFVGSKGDIKIYRIGYNKDKKIFNPSHIFANSQVSTIVHENEIFLYIINIHNRYHGYIDLLNDIISAISEIYEDYYITKLLKQEKEQEQMKLLYDYIILLQLGQLILYQQHSSSLYNVIEAVMTDKDFKYFIVKQRQRQQQLPKILLLLQLQELYNIYDKILVIDIVHKQEGKNVSADLNKNLNDNLNSLKNQINEILYLVKPKLNIYLTREEENDLKYVLEQEKQENIFNNAEEKRNIVDKFMKTLRDKKIDIDVQETINILEKRIKHLQEQKKTLQEKLNKYLEVENLLPYKLLILKQQLRELLQQLQQLMYLENKLSRNKKLQKQDTILQDLQEQDTILQDLQKQDTINFIHQLLAKEYYRYVKNLIDSQNMFSRIKYIYTADYDYIWEERYLIRQQISELIYRMPTYETSLITYIQKQQEDLLRQLKKKCIEIKNKYDINILLIGDFNDFKYRNPRENEKQINNESKSHFEKDVINTNEFEKLDISKYYSNYNDKLTNEYSKNELLKIYYFLGKTGKEYTFKLIDIDPKFQIKTSSHLILIFEISKKLQLSLKRPHGELEEQKQVKRIKTTTTYTEPRYYEESKEESKGSSIKRLQYPSSYKESKSHSRKESESSHKESGSSSHKRSEFYHK